MPAPRRLGSEALRLLQGWGRLRSDKRQILFKRSYLMELTSILVMIFGIVFLFGGAAFFIKLAYDNTKKKKTK